MITKQELKEELSEKYKIIVLAVNCAQLKVEDINQMMENVLYEFPIKKSILIHLVG